MFASLLSECEVHSAEDPCSTSRSGSWIPPLLHTIADFTKISFVGPKALEVANGMTVTSGLMPPCVARRSGPGTSADSKPSSAERLRPAPAGAAGTAELVNEIAGSGPWIWAGSGPLSFMRGGVLQTPWGTGTWGVSRAGGETAPADAVFADFAGSQHTVRMHVPECLRMQSRRKADDDVVGINFIGNGASVAASAGNEGACLDSTVAAP